MPEKALIYFLYHSGIAVKTNNYFLIFDYYLDESDGEHRNMSHGVISASDFDENLKNFVFVSHNHHDHYNPVIFNWDQEENIQYLLSKDINPPREKPNYVMVSEDETYNINNLNIRTLGSTDRGVSFLVKTDFMNIFHAGDLNWWCWKNYSPAEKEREENDFKKEIDKLAGEEIDIAFIPVDPRLGENYYLAGKYLVEKITPDLIVPIHFADNYKITEKFKKKMKDLPVNIARIKKRGQQIALKS